MGAGLKVTGELDTSVTVLTAPSFTWAACATASARAWASATAAFNARRSSTSWSEGPSIGPFTRFAPAATAASTIEPDPATSFVVTLTEFEAVKLMIFVPVWFVFGVSEISAVWIAAGGTPRSLIAAISAFIRRAFAVSADFAVGAVTETPKENCASSGTVVTIPVPCTVIVRGAADACPAPRAAAAAAAGRSSVSVFIIDDCTPPVALASHGVALNIELTRFGYGDLLVFVPKEVVVVRKLRFVLPVIVVLLAISAASAKAVARMPVGFFDDPSFRWAAEPTVNLASAQKANGSIIHVLANWSTIAPTKPARPLNGSDPAYHLSDIDALARSAQKYGFEILLTIYGTPKWANGGKAPNYPPTNLTNLTQFSQMLALRYNGTNPGYGVVTRYSVWNEPNLGSFLSPQFSKSGKIVSPATYAKLYMAAYKGIKAGNKVALVAAGETSNRGLNHHVASATDSVAPATFARLLSVANPKLPFDAWATHPYPSGAYTLGPAQKVAYPNVGFSTMSRFGADLQKWFHRQVPIWVTEYGEQTKPEHTGYPRGVSYAQQAVDVKKALQLASASPYVQMFVWFIFRDSTPATWFSGVVTKSGTKKPAYTTFATTAKGMVGDTEYVTAGKKISVSLAVPIMTYRNAIGAKVGMTYYLYDGKKLVSIGQPLVPIQKGGMITVPVKYVAAKGKTYTLALAINDKHGYKENKTLLLLPNS